MRTVSSEPAARDVGQLLLLGGVHVHLVETRVLPDDHPLVDLDARTDEHRSALLQVHRRVAGGHPAPVGDERPAAARAQLAEPRRVAVEHVVQDAGAARLGQELGAEPDQAAGRNAEFDAHPTGAVVDHLLHAALAQRQQLRHDAEVVLRDVDAEQLDRLVQLAVDLAW